MEDTGCDERLPAELQGRYADEALIGSGAFGRVYRATCLRAGGGPVRRGQTVAIKIISKSEMRRQRIDEARVLKEIEIHKTLDHPNIVKLYEALQTSSHVCIVIEYCPQGDMDKHLRTHGKLSERDAAVVFRQLVSAVEYMHGRGVIHRDLSTANVFIAAGGGGDALRVKIGDLGLATEHGGGAQAHTHRTMCGTPNFMSPEVALRAGHDHRADVWSLGALLYALVTGRPPFGNGNQQVSETLGRIIAGRAESAADGRSSGLGDMSAGCRQLITCMMCANARRRITLRQAAEHPFLASAARPSTLRRRDVGGDDNLAGGVRRMKLESAVLSSADSGRGASLPRAPLPRYRGGGDENENPDRDRGMQAPPVNASQFTRASVYSEPTAAASDLGSRAVPFNPNVPSTSAWSTDAGAAGRTAAGESRQQRSQQRPAGAEVAAVCTARLKPQAQRSKVALWRILDNGEARAEYVDEEGVVRKVVCADGDGGGKVTIFRPCQQWRADVERLAPPADHSAVKRYSVANRLPAEHLRHYKGLVAFVRTVAQATPKVTLYSAGGKCALKESGDFEFKLDSGADGRNAGKTCTTNRSSGTWTTRWANGQAAELTDSEECAFQKLQSQCWAIEHALDALSATGAPCFPAIVGRRHAAAPAAVVALHNTPAGHGGGAAEQHQRRRDASAAVNSTRRPLNVHNGDNVRRDYQRSYNNGGEVAVRRANSYSAKAGSQYSQYVAEFGCTFKKNADGSCTIRFGDHGETLTLSGDALVHRRRGAETRYDARTMDRSQLPAEIRERLQHVLVLSQR